MVVLGTQRLSGVLPNVWQSWRRTDLFDTIYSLGERNSAPVFQATKDSNVVWIDVATGRRHPCSPRLSASDTLHPYPNLYSHYYDKPAESLYWLNLDVEEAIFWRDTQSTILPLGV